MEFLKKKYSFIILLLFSAAFFILGLTFPIMETKQKILGLTLKHQEIKLFDSVIMFYDENDFLLAIIILLFTIIFPILKYFEIGNRILSVIRCPNNISQFLKVIDKWSMLDVFLIAILLLNFKLDSNLIFMKISIGTSFLAISIVLRMMTSFLIDYKIEKNEK